jgi:hypothetical protein
MTNFSVTIENGAYVVKFPYDPGAVAALKARILPHQRSWDNTRKVWIIARECKGNAEIVFGTTFPDIAGLPPVTEVRLLEIHYIGQCKERAPGEISAMGLTATGSWGVVFPETVLRAWFEDDTNLGGQWAVTLYAILGAKQSDDEAALKSAYRRMVRQWHPDVCREPDAHTRFLKLQEAWAILGDPRKKSRYDAGLALEMSLRDGSKKRGYQASDLYRSPLRCGYIMAEGVESLGRFVVSQIIGWEDVTNERGQVLVVSWPMGADKPEKAWA